ncbi:hypothetical protein H6F90_05925 [Trichocoleus sp. FACHB-591]|uniref:hypothetical protein n=1 Tax=Trichocoleus sp. FACHB-591 TaxID=2692872 RepID=UPI0016845D32|nr:hypothetical protein [Trichocoleus sp. FACHB-591]MBD2094687.1 hypothetical protein [Trichocoleus sp. FACHB-591]
MAQLSRRLRWIAPRLLIAGTIAFPVYLITSGLLAYLTAPYLLNSESAIQTYMGFYFWHPNLAGKVSNLRCFTNGKALDDYAYYCRFQLKPADVQQLVRKEKLAVGQLDEEGCEPPYLASPPGTYLNSFPQGRWWRPSKIELGEQAQCYSQRHTNTTELVYSPASQIAYLRHSDLDYVYFGE